MSVGCKGHQKVKNGQKKQSQKKLFSQVLWDTLYIFGGEEKKEKCLEKEIFGWRKLEKEKEESIKRGKKSFCGGEKYLEKKKNCGREEQRRRAEGKHLKKEKCFFGREDQGVSCKRSP